MSPAPERGAVLRAVIFDVDGTLVDSERHGHRVAFNRAFEELGLPWRWDEDLYGELLHVTGGQRRIAGFLAGEGVPEDERASLAPALHARKTSILKAMVADGAIEVRPGVTRLLEQLAGAGCSLGIGTTGSRGWVDGLLRRLLPGTSWDAVVTGDEVARRKPDPEVFEIALDRLGLGGTAEAVLVEPRPAEAVLVEPRPAEAVLVEPRPAEAVLVEPRPAEAVLVEPRPAEAVLVEPRPAEAVLVEPRPAEAVLVEPRPAEAVLVEPRPAEAVIIEDSAEGLAAARAAGLPCVVVVNGYTADHDLTGADLVLDGFGELGAPAKVLDDPHATGCVGILDPAVLRILLRCHR